MYAKIFESIYDGTLAENWQALVTFQQLLVLASADGVVDMTPAAISRKTGIPIEIIQAGITHLEVEDPHSRTPDMGGRRIGRMDDHRTWGWFIVNHQTYRLKVTREEKREADRARISAKRGFNRINDVATCRNLSQPVSTSSEVSPKVANVAHTDTDTDTDIDIEKKDQKIQQHAETENLEAKSKKGRRGARLPDGWEPDGELRKWAASEFPHVALELATAGFRDYWAGVPGQRGCKSDWPATWRNRIREVAARKPKIIIGGSNGTYRESLSERVARLNAEAEERERLADESIEGTFRVVDTA